MAAAALADDVSVEQVRALLFNRSPDLFDGTEYTLYEASVEGVTTEVVAVVGADPQGEQRKAALWCIALGAASLIEAALFPEQQIGDQGRAEVLRRRFLGVLAMLRSMDEAGVADQSGAAAGRFPDPTPYPDPARPAVYPYAYGGIW